MKSRLFLPLFIVIIMIASVILGSCGEATPTASPTPTPTGGGPQYGGTFTWNHNGGITQIGAPVDNMGIAGNRNTYPMFEGLLKSNDAGELTPWLATSWDTSADGKTITLKLVHDVKFQDGTDFDAEAVKYNLEAVYKANLSGTAFMGNVESYTVLDKYTIQIKLKEIDSLFLLRITSAGTLGFMASPAAQQKATTPETVPQVHSVGTGPFLFDGWERDSYVKYKKWDGYRDKTKPYLDAIVLNNTADISVSIMALLAGETDSVENVDPVDAIRLKGMGYTIYQPNLYYLHSICPAGNDPNSPFHDKRVRLALEYAIDKRTIAAGVGMGYYEPLNQLATPRDPYYNPDMPFREYDPVKAKQLLAEAGYENGFTTKLITDVMARRDTLVAVQTYLEAVGIKTEMEILDFGAAFTMPRTGWEGIYFPGFPNVGTLLGVLGRYGDKTTFVSMYQPEGWWDKWDALVKELDPVKRIGILKDIMKLAYDEVVYIPYQGDAPLVAINPDVHGFEHHALHIVSYWDPANCWKSK